MMHYNIKLLTKALVFQKDVNKVLLLTHSSRDPWGHVVVFTTVPVAGHGFM